LAITPRNSSVSGQKKQTKRGRSLTEGKPRSGGVGVNQLNTGGKGGRKRRDPTNACLWFTPKDPRKRGAGGNQRDGKHSLPPCTIEKVQC